MTKISARSGVVHVGIRLVPILAYACQLKQVEKGVSWPTQNMDWP